MQHLFPLPRCPLSSSIVSFFISMVFTDQCNGEDGQVRHKIMGTRLPCLVCYTLLVATASAEKVSRSDSYSCDSYFTFSIQEMISTKTMTKSKTNGQISERLNW